MLHIIICSSVIAMSPIQHPDLVIYYFDKIGNPCLPRMILSYSCDFNIAVSN